MKFPFSFREKVGMGNLSGWGPPQHPAFPVFFSSECPIPIFRRRPVFRMESSGSRTVRRETASSGFKKSERGLKGDTLDGEKNTPPGGGKIGDIYRRIEIIGSWGGSIAPPRAGSPSRYHF
ncbi:MAG TPA: hypothetical protein DDZ83_20095 [Nitrospinae bacterium]|nr:hypothetical protein [Nitrospinota bacterium]